MPKKIDYFAELNTQAALAKQAADLFRQPDIFQMPKLMQKVELLSAESERIRQKIVRALLDDFLPPMERGNLRSLAAALAGLPQKIAASFRPGGFQSTQTEEADISKRLINAFEILPQWKKRAIEMISLADQLRKQEIYKPIADALEAAVVDNI
jgi:hypothetical protein